MPAIKQFRINTPAKINFSLLIQKERSDGYHDLLLDFFPINLFDTITFKTKEDGKSSLTSDYPELNCENNTILKAIDGLQTLSKKKVILDVNLVKKIPMGAGLGGGSGNAAGTLIVLNDIYQLKLTHKQLEKIALSIGADVPFFLNPNPAFASGIGQKLTPITTSDQFFLVVIFPDLHISTKEAYKNCNISGRIHPIQNYSFETISRLPLIDLNDFWKYLSSRYPEFKKCESSLKKTGAFTVGLSGSGSSVFGIFKNQSDRDQAILNMNLSKSYQIIGCETMDSYSYLPF